MYPGRVELHLHMDGALTEAFARECLKQQGIKEPEDLAAALAAQPLCENLVDYLKCFDIPLRILQYAETLERCAFDLVCQLAGQGYVYAELRFAPRQPLRKRPDPAAGGGSGAAGNPGRKGSVPGNRHRAAALLYGGRRRRPRGYPERRPAVSGAGRCGRGHGRGRGHGAHGALPAPVCPGKGGGHPLHHPRRRVRQLGEHPHRPFLRGKAHRPQHRGHPLAAVHGTAAGERRGAGMLLHQQFADPGGGHPGGASHPGIPAGGAAGDREHPTPPSRPPRWPTNTGCWRISSAFPTRSFTGWTALRWKPPLWARGRGRPCWPGWKHCGLRGRAEKRKKGVRVTSDPHPFVRFENDAVTRNFSGGSTRCCPAEFRR